MTATFTDDEAAEALVQLVGSSGWVAVALARGYLLARSGATDEAIARALFETGSFTLTKARDHVPEIKRQGFRALVPPRERTGSAENPITKLFPATITEERFVERLDGLCERVSGLTYSDDREVGHGLADFRLEQGDLELPVNVKNAGTRFRRAAELVGLDPDDCVPIPAYKAYGALETMPNLIYAVSVDYDLVRVLEVTLPALFDRQETIVWALLNEKGGSRLRSAEDAFIFAAVRKHWTVIRDKIGERPYAVISARKSIRVLQTKPKRTPGIGLRAWGTGASAEVNVHLSIREDMMMWDGIEERILSKGLDDVIGAVNRKRMESVYDPEI
jgi:hypothetical protein